MHLLATDDDGELAGPEVSVTEVRSAPCGLRWFFSSEHAQSVSVLILKDAALSDELGDHCAITIGHDAFEVLAKVDGEHVLLTGSDEGACLSMSPGATDATLDIVREVVAPTGVYRVTIEREIRTCCSGWHGFADAAAHLLPTP
jgi:hypothetical protein